MEEINKEKVMALGSTFEAEFSEKWIETIDQMIYSNICKYILELLKGSRILSKYKSTYLNAAKSTMGIIKKDISYSDIYYTHTLQDIEGICKHYASLIVTLLHDFCCEENTNDNV